MATEVREVAREVDGVQAPSVVQVASRTDALTISGEPRPGDTVHIACRVVGVREQDGRRVAILEPEEVVG